MKVKVAYLISTLGTGGAEKQLVRSLNLIDKNKYVVKLFVLTNVNEIENELDKEIEIEYFNLSSYLNLKNHYVVQKRLRHFNPVLIHSVLYASNLFARFYKFSNPKTKIINHIHGLGSWIKKPHIYLDRILLPFVDKIIVVSQKSKNLRLIREKYPKSKVEVVYNCVNQELYKPEIKKISNSDIILGIACRLIPLKNVNYIINICKILKDSNLPIKLKIAGIGPEKENLIKLTTQLGLNKEVEFLGLVKNMPKFYQEIDCFILSSIIEDLPLSIVEALMANKPFISSNVGGIEELSLKTISLLFNLEDGLEQNANKIVTFLQSSGYRFLNHKNRNYAMKCFGQESHKQSLENIYMELIS